MVVELTEREVAVITAILGETSGNVTVYDDSDLTYQMYGKFLSIADEELVKKITCSCTQVVTGDLRP